MSDKVKRRLALILLVAALVVMLRYEFLHYNTTWVDAIKDDLVSFILSIVLMLGSFALFLATKNFDDEEDYYDLRKKRNKHRKKRDLSDDGQV